MTINRKKHKSSYKQLLLYFSFRILQFFSSRMASWLAYHWWLHPGRQVFSSHDSFAPPGISALQVRVNSKRVSYWVVGQTACKSVFLLHGWAGCGRQMSVLAQGLIDAGYRVIWMDAPAHCESEGWQTSLFEFAESIRQIQQQEGNFEAIIAHSFGVPCSLYAIRNYGVMVRCIVAIAAPPSTEKLMEIYTTMIKANAQTRRKLLERFEKFLGHISIQETSAEYNARWIPQPVLLIHDKKDRITSLEVSKHLKNCFQHAQLLQTQGLGHNRILKDAAVVDACVAFIQKSTLSQFSG